MCHVCRSIPWPNHTVSQRLTASNTRPKCLLTDILCGYWWLRRKCFFFKFEVYHNRFLQIRPPFNFAMSMFGKTSAFVTWKLPWTWQEWKKIGYFLERHFNYRSWVKMSAIFFWQFFNQVYSAENVGNSHSSFICTCSISVYSWVVCKEKTMIFFTKLFEARILLSSANCCDLVHVNFTDGSNSNGTSVNISCKTERWCNHKSHQNRTKTHMFKRKFE